MKDYAEYQGYTDIRGSRDAIRKALQIGLIEDKRWMETIEDRNLTSQIMMTMWLLKFMRISYWFIIHYFAGLKRGCYVYRKMRLDEAVNEIWIE